MVADFIQRVSAYPVVTACWQRANTCYGWAKTASPAPLRSATDVAEAGLLRAARSAAPLLSRLEPLDRLACQQLLDRLEARCPAVKAPTDQLVEAGREYYASAVKPRLEAVLAPVNGAVAKYRRLSDGGATAAAWMDACVDRYLPEPKAAVASADEDDSASPDGVGVLFVGRKLRRRLARRMAAEAAAARQEFAARMADEEERQAAAAEEADGVDSADSDAETLRRRFQAVSRAGVAFAAARLPDLEDLPGAARLAGWLSVYSRDQLQFDPFDLENRLMLLAESQAGGKSDLPGNGGCDASFK